MVKKRLLVVSIISLAFIFRLVFHSCRSSLHAFSTTAKFCSTSFMSFVYLVSKSNNEFFIFVLIDSASSSFLLFIFRFSFNDSKFTSLSLDTLSIEVTILFTSPKSNAIFSFTLFNVSMSSVTVVLDSVICELNG